MNKQKRKIIAFSAVIAMLISSMQVSAVSGISPFLTAQAESTDSRILVDINRNDGRKASYSKNANNWLVDGTYTYTINGITCKLSADGGSVDLVNNKILQLQNVEKTPTLTMDGAKVKDGTSNPTLKLEISGLPEDPYMARLC